MNLKNDFLKFISGNKAPPQDISKNILNRVRKDLSVTSFGVFKKISLLHLIAGGVTLIFCPQFGIGPIGGGGGATSFVMTYGHLVCGLFCGSVFLGSGSLVTFFVLSCEELWVLDRNKMWQFPILVGSLLAVLMLVGKILQTSPPMYSFGFITFWIIAALLIPLGLMKIRFLFQFIKQ